MGITSNIIKMFFGSKAEKDAKTINPVVDTILAVEPSIQSLTNDQLRQKTRDLQQKIRKSVEPQEDEINELKKTLEGTEIEVNQKSKSIDRIDAIKKEIDKKIEEVLEEILPEAFAIMKDTARRFTQNETIEVTASQSDKELSANTKFVAIEADKAIYNTTWKVGEDDLKWDMIHYREQLFGGIVLHRGNIAEMATGEGKTLVATLPVFLNALAGKGVHVVTVNDYLARRDAQWMGPLYQFHGLTVDCIDLHQPNSEARRTAYASDIIFGTNNEFGFDYLRDNLATSIEDMVQRKHHFAIIDEADSILIDDARTPLIISGTVANDGDQLFMEYSASIQNLYKKQREVCADYLLQAKKAIEQGKTEEAGELLFRSYKGFPKNKVLIKFLSDPEMKRMLLNTEKKYLENNEKLMPEAKKDLLFAVDEKNRQVELTDRGHEELAKRYASEDFFILQHFGEAAAAVKNNHDLSESEKEEKLDKLREEHSIKAERVHTVSQLLKAYALFEIDVDYVIQNGKVMIVDEQTGRILDGRRYSDGLHQAIEAKEGVKIEAASQTVATITLQNYFRMYHKLSGMTGTAETEAGEFWDIYKLDVIVIPTHRPIIRKDRDDLIYRTKREKYNAVIDDIVKLVSQGRPVLVGTTSVEISEFLSRSLRLRKIDHSVLNAKLHESEAQIVAEAGKPGKVTIATNMAGRGTDIKLTQEVREAGGLAIVGTERHDSRRVDRQLRGRSGRQGDDGSSQFFVSLEDDLMRLFGAERISKVMTTLKMADGEPIQAGMISRAIENAQKKVEENNFGMRKKLLEYDNVMNDQRNVVYTRRHNALSGERIDVDLNNMMDDFADTFVTSFRSEKDEFDQYADLPSADRFRMELFEQLSIPVSSTREDIEELMGTEFADIVYSQLLMTQNELDTLTDVQIADKLFLGLQSACYFPLRHIARALIGPVNRYAEDFKKGIENYKGELEKKVEEDIKAASSKKELSESDLNKLHNTVEQGIAAYKERFGKVMIPLRGANIGGKHELRFLLDINREGGMDADIIVRRMIQAAVLEVIDLNWQSHLREMDDLKTSVQNASYEQKDPVLIYKLESYTLFRSMLENVNTELLATLINLRSANREEQQPQQTQPRKETISRMQAGRSDSPQGVNNASGSAKPAPARTEKLVGRNDPCPCGSGKKFKNCHGAV